ncbi:hypothetical protein F9K79_09715 [Ochrobactrum sp. Kaboul]|nr:hypothetical protein F9K79_09715 [Ochrobactrum sp. Kaboul]
MPFIDLTHRRFGRLTALAIQRGGRRSYWTCQCDCGNTKVVSISKLTSGNTKSCGCLRSELVTAKNMKHGQKRHPLYSVWRSMKNRCYNPEFNQFKDYGGRGIKVCPEWLDDPAAFIAWGEANGYRKGLDIDRENNGWNYSPQNCRFVSRKTSNRNRRNCRYIDTPAGRMMIAEAVEVSGLSRSLIYYRIGKGWPTDRLFEPATYGNKEKPL